MGVKLRAALWLLVGALFCLGRRVLRGGRPLRPGWSLKLEFAVYMALWFQRRYPSFDVEIVRDLIGDVPPGQDALAHVDIEETTLAGLHAFRVRPENAARRKVLHFHGGGYIIGTASGCREFLAHFCRGAHAEVITVDYRLAPEHPYPAALDDAFACYQALLDDGTRPEDILLSGESAGGGLALALQLKLRDEGRPLPAGAYVYSPWVQVESNRASYAENGETDILGPAGIHRARELYLAGHDPHDPYVSPIYGDWTGLPPQFLLVGGAEVFRDDIRAFKRVLDEAGVGAVLEEEPHMPHTWLYLKPGVDGTGPATLALGERVRAFWDDATGETGEPSA